MYELTVTSEFCAAHAITIAGVPETVHGHNFKVSLRLAGETLDADGLLCNFHALDAALNQTLGPFHNADLNATPPFDRLNPTAEHIARFIAQSVATKIAPILPPGAFVRSCTVTEAPRCAATYSPPTPTNTPTSTPTPTNTAAPSLPHD